jgi:hypothetical protein
MAKSSKKSKETAVPETNPAPPSLATGNDDRAAHSSQPAGAKSQATKRVKPARSAKSTGKGRSEAVSTRKSRTGAPRKNRAPGKVTASDEEIRLRAYFISERRMQHGILGDSAHDWLEAQRQLQKEAKKRA